MQPAHHHWIALIAITICVGCQNAEENLRSDLKAFGVAHITYQEEKKQSPSNWDELIAFAEQNGLAAESIKRVRDAGYEVTWDLDVSAPASTVLAKATGEKPVLLAGGRVPEDNAEQ